jgi:hypothetical protein
MIRLTECFKRVDLVFSSKTRLRFVGNCVLFGLALFVSMTFMLFQYQENIVNQIGSWIVSSYKHPYKADQSQAEVWLREGKIDSVISLLNEDDWKQIQLGDRVYPLKRQILLRLCGQLEVVERYKDLHYWANVLRDLNRRDVTAWAYWFESMRHIKGRGEEGRQGLQKAWKDFPVNAKLAGFHARALQESGDIDGALAVIKEVEKRSLVVMVEGWKIEFGRHSKDLFPKYWRQFLDRLRRMEWASAMTSGRALWREAFNANARRIRKASRGKVERKLTLDLDGRVTVLLQVPSNITRLTMHPPGMFKLAVSDIRVTMLGQTHYISPGQTRFDGMHDHKKWLEVTGVSPWVQFTLPDFERRTRTGKLNVDLTFKVALKTVEGEFFSYAGSRQ